MIAVTVQDTVDLAALETRWRDLQARADGSFFLSATWIFCLAQERFPNPVLVAATENGRTVALALFNRRRRWGRTTLFLHENGSAALDCPYIEQNGVLTEAGREAELTTLCLAAVARRGTLVLSGVDDRTLASLRSVAGRVRVRRTHMAPYADLAATRADGQEFLARRSANTRQQLRRSMRWYGAGSAAAEAADLVIQRANSVAEAQTMLDALAALHQQYWQARGQAGSFAEPFFRRFHRALIARGWPNGEIVLQRVCLSGTILGFLYNIQFRRRCLAYQSGIQYQPSAPDARPGLLAHCAAIRDAIDNDMTAYDFLAGDARYKRSLSDGAYASHWLVSHPRRWWLFGVSGG